MGAGDQQQATVTVTEFRNELRRWLEAVYFYRRPVVVERHGIEYVVVVHIDDYRRLVSEAGRRARAAEARTGAPAPARDDQ